MPSLMSTSFSPSPEYRFFKSSYSAATLRCRTKETRDQRMGAGPHRTIALICQAAATLGISIVDCGSRTASAIPLIIDGA